MTYISWFLIVYPVLYTLQFIFCSFCVKVAKWLVTLEFICIFILCHSWQVSAHIWVLFYQYESFVCGAHRNSVYCRSS